MLSSILAAVISCNFNICLLKVVIVILFINHLNKEQWWEFDQEKMMAYNYMGGHHNVNEEQLEDVEILDYDSWHELYINTGFCPLETDKWERDVWISPDGKFYDGDAHEVRAAYLLDIVYGIPDVDYGGDLLEERGWVRATTSLMWNVRFQEWEGKRLTQKQYGALLEWCQSNRMKFPHGIVIKRA